ncbi:hypothetical protein LguiB_021071 [Lonicera macranthoides]
MVKMIPRWHVFDPTDHILIKAYLNRKVRGEELPCVGTVFEMERHYIYRGKQPWDIFYMIAQDKNKRCNAVYLFTTPPPNECNTSTQLPIITNIRGLIHTFIAYFLSQFLRVSASNSSNNNNNNNSNDGGMWKAQGNGAYVPVKDPDNGNQVIGFKKIFIYQQNDDSNQDAIQWVMTEYTTLQPLIMQSLDRVVCKIEKIEKIEEVSDDSVEDEEEFDDESI